MWVPEEIEFDEPFAISSTPPIGIPDNQSPELLDRFPHPTIQTAIPEYLSNPFRD
jgi:hypothetical protein